MILCAPSYVTLITLDIIWPNFKCLLTPMWHYRNAVLPSFKCLLTPMWNYRNAMKACT